MILSLDVRRARKGDCLILHYGSKDDPGLILIDGGPSQVYGPHLKPRLAEIRKARGLKPDASLPVDLMMVSHIDDDHINGILELTGELVEAKTSGRPLPLKVRSFWHNTFDDIIGNSAKELVGAVTASFGTASLNGEADVEGLDPDAAKVLASVDQSFRLRNNAKFLQLRLNPQFGGKLVMAKGKGNSSLDLGKGLKMTVAGPLEEELIELQKEHDAFLKKAEKKKEATASFTDESAANLSSLVLLAEVGKKRILLTGDARGDKMLNGLEQVGLLKKDGKSKMHVDIFKMPHHGSDRNVDPIVFERITADHYVFSGNGEHGNPERATLEMLLDARGDKEDYTIHLTYPIDETDAERKVVWGHEQQKEKAKKLKNPKAKTKVRANWSPKKHSLAALFADNPEFGKKVKIVDAKAPHVINLLDKLGY
jgi:beta-lactamase superfamily II metal-dependent hydrolase